MKVKKVFVCSECGYESAKWYGKCPACGEWNTMKEERVFPETTSRSLSLSQAKNTPTLINSVDIVDEKRILSGISEFDRVLGGGAVVGSLILISGEPGIGKSTLLMQACNGFLTGNRSILYISGEESLKQLKMRAERILSTINSFYLLTEVSLNEIIKASDDLRPDIIVIDSIQSIYRDDIDSSPGSITQVRECAISLLQYAKNNNTTIFLVGQVNKEGAIAGPKVLEHMVDCVLYIDKSNNETYRMLSAVKNRYGSTNEFGLFEMTDSGLIEVTNPSAALLSGRPQNASGSSVACIMEGTRPVLAEIQALVTKTSYANPRRLSVGIEYNRMTLMIGIIEKRTKVSISNYDVYINVIGGLQLEESAVDLPLAMAIISSYYDKPIPDDVVCFGEVGLTGEIRAIHQIENRINESIHQGYKRCIIPNQDTSKIKTTEGTMIYKVKTIKDAIDILF